MATVQITVSRKCITQEEMDELYALSERLKEKCARQLNYITVPGDDMSRKIFVLFARQQDCLFLPTLRTRMRSPPVPEAAGNTESAVT